MSDRNTTEMNYRGLSGNTIYLDPTRSKTDFMTCLSVVEEGPRIAFAAYIEESNVIILEDCLADGFEIKEIYGTIQQTIHPDLILASSKIIGNEPLLEVLTTIQVSEGEILQADELEKRDENDYNGSENKKARTDVYKSQTIPYRLMKSSAYDVKSCRGTILKLKVASLMNLSGRSPTHHREVGNDRRFLPKISANDDHHFRFSSYHALATVVDFDSRVEIQALGSLLSFLQSTVFRLNDSEFVSVNDIVRGKSSKHMRISFDTLSSLHVFATEHHPMTAAKGHGQSKEGFSLFSLLDRTRSSAGRQRLREWMLKPSGDLDLITCRQDGVELFAMLTDVQSSLKTMSDYLEHIGAMDKLLVRIQKCCAKSSDFLLLAKALSSAIAISTTLQDEVMSWLIHGNVTFPTQRNIGPLSDQNKIQSYMKFIDSILSHCHVATLRTLFDRVTSIIDEEATFECKAIVIRTGHHEQLDACKQQFASLEDTLELTGSVVTERLPHLKSRLQVIFIPQVGFLVALDNQINWKEQGLIPQDFAFVFTEGGQSFFKSSEVRDLDERIGDLDAYIKDTETFILAELEEEILDFEYQIRETFSALADLDCIFAFASCACELQYVRPVVLPANENCIEIVNGRHPLQEILMESNYKMNSIQVNESRIVNIITGPNFSGKSCYTSQAGLLVYMAHIGCFIPCDEARISIVGRIIARFNSPETCSIPQSSFQLDLTQMGQSLRLASDNSLVLIDEFGKGTSPASGIALLTASLRLLLNKKCKVICTTHFLEVFSLGFLKDGEGIKTLQMAVSIDNDSAENVTPLFRLQDGVASSSAGLVCARKAGVSEIVLSRASELLLAAKERRKVLPLVELLRIHLTSSVEIMQLLDMFMSVNWVSATDNEIDKLILATDNVRLGCE